MSSFDDQNDDSILEIPLFERIKCKTSIGQKSSPVNESSGLDSNGTEMQTTDKSNDTLTLDSDSNEEDIEDNKPSDHSLDTNDDSIEVIFSSPQKQCNETDNKDNELIGGNTSLASIASNSSRMTDWTPIKPHFINRTPFMQKKVENRTKSSVKKSINTLNKKQLNVEKVEKQKERNERKALKEWEKNREKVHKEVLRSKVVKHSVKYCFAVIDRSLYEMIGQSIDDMFEKNECNYRLTDTPVVPSSVTWIRKSLNVVEENGSESSGQLSQTSVANTETQEKHILVVIEANDFIRRVHSFVTQSGETLFEFVEEVIQKSNIKNITLLVSKLSQYFKRQKSKSQNQFKQRLNELNANETNRNQNRRQNRRDSMPSVTREDIDLAIIDMEFKVMRFDSQSKVSVIKANDLSDITTYIYRYTRSVAESLARKEKSSQSLGWYAEADNRNTVDPVDAQSHQKLWKRQLMEFPKISYEVANAIASKYPTPRSLLDRYRREPNPELLLSDIIVSRRQPNGTNTERKVGPELSQTIHLFMTSRNCDQLLSNRDESMLSVIQFRLGSTLQPMLES